MQRYNYEIESLIDDVKDEHNYLSETKKEVLNNVKGNYPQLCTYESEWIYFDETGYNPGEPVGIEYQMVEGANGIVENAIPHNYKSAILKGNTIKNEIKTFASWYSLGLDYTTFPIKANTRYYIYWNLNYAPTRVGFLYYDNNGSAQFNGTIYDESFKTKDYVILTSGNVNNNEIIRFRFRDTATEQPTGEIMVIEYQEGMGSWNIPYFEGMQSVKMPVLKTTGKNLFNVKTVKKGYTVSTDTGLEATNDKRYITDFIYVKGFTHLTITNPERTQNIWGYDENKQPIRKIKSSGVNGNFTVSIPSDIAYVRMPFAKIDQSDITDEFIRNNLVQVEAGEQFTSYEPYKSNILMVNEEVTLRGIGEVKDELNLLTGELVQKTEKIIFDGSEAWEVVSSLEKDNTIFAQCYKYTRNNTNAISNILDYISSLDALDKRGFRFNHFFQIRLNKNEISNITNNGVKEWVSKNNIIVVRVEEQTVKTVDLTPLRHPFEGYNQFTTSSDTIPPSMNLQVPVVSTGEQTIQEINE